VTDESRESTEDMVKRPSNSILAYSNLAEQVYLIDMLRGAKAYNRYR
jgi:hypothetical protein